MKLLRKVRKNDANDYERERLAIVEDAHVKADAKSLTDAIIKMDNVVKAANNSELKKSWEDFLFVYNNLAEKPKRPKGDALDDAAKIIQRILRSSEASEDVNAYMKAENILKGIRFWEKDAKSKLRKARLLLLGAQYDDRKEQVKKEIDPLFRELINKANEI